MSAIDDLRYIAKRFQGVLELVPTLEGIDSVENHLKELRVKKDQLVKEVANEAEKLKAAKDFTEDAGQEGITLVAAAKAKASDILANAEAKAEATLNDAIDSANKTVQEAEVKAFEVREDIKMQEKALAILGTMVSEKQALYDELTGKFADLKSKL